jgi:hypothetical protein
MTPPGPSTAGPARSPPQSSIQLSHQSINQTSLCEDYLSLSLCTEPRNDIYLKKKLPGLWISFYYIDKDPAFPRSGLPSRAKKYVRSWIFKNIFTYLQLLALTGRK